MPSEKTIAEQPQPSEFDGMPIGKLASEYIDSRNRLAVLDLAHKKLGARINDLERRLVSELGEAGLQSLKTETGETLSLFNDVHVSVLASNKSDAITALKELGYGYIIKEDYAPSTFKALIKEMIGEFVDAEQIPEPLRKVVRIYQETGLRMRKS